MKIQNKPDLELQNYPPPQKNKTLEEKHQKTTTPRSRKTRFLQFYDHIPDLRKLY